jgi:hypothetical protein
MLARYRVTMDWRSPPARRFQDVQSTVEHLVTTGKFDPDQARWFMLSRQIVAQHRHQDWLHAGAPRRRAEDSR